MQLADHEQGVAALAPSPCSVQRSRLLPNRSLPSYAYLPGMFPHPVRDPAGHSYDHGAPPTSGDPDAFLWGVDLFDHGYYWEAHEAWEPLWRAAARDSVDRDMLKGLILLSAAGVKLREWKLAAAERHGRRAAALLRAASTGSAPSFGSMLGVSPAALAEGAEAATMPRSVSESGPSAQKAVFPFILAGPFN